MQTVIPPYLDISPERALADLGPAPTVRDLMKIAQACRQGMASLTPDAEGRKRLRLFSTWEITRYLIPVATQHFRRVLRQNPDLPQGRSDTEGGAKWFTFEEILRLRAHFGAEGSKAKEYRPYRPEGLPPKIVALANVRSGVGKTTTAAHLAMSAALDGYRVLVIDLDSQGAMTSIFDGRVEDAWGTVFPLIARHHALHLRAENADRVGRGDPPLPLDETLAAALRLAPADLIRPTHWPNIDLIGAQLDLARAELRIPAWRLQSRSWKPWDALGDALSDTGVLDRYDLVVLDTPPALGHLTIAGLSAADILLVPLGASAREFEAAVRFFEMLAASFAEIEDSENLAAQALGRPEVNFGWDAVRALITRYDGNRQAETAARIQSVMGRVLSLERQEETDLVTRVGAVYETDYRSVNRETYMRGRMTFDETYASLKRLLYGIWQREEKARKERRDVT